ncbi:MAG: alpha/beta hydrolase [Lentisphaerae bacterium]|nr:alpha/beta hydrolase [Lentisphaerota bacterium]
MPVYDIAYRADHDRGTLDVFAPAGSGPFAVVVVLHGGGWVEGQKDHLRPYAEILNALGYVAVLPNYRLATTAPHPAQCDDTLAALDWVGAHGPEFGADPQRLGLTGTSAGGHLAALAGLIATREPSPAYSLRAVLPVCGVYDVPQWLRDCPQYRRNVSALVGGIPEEMAHAMRDSSPITHIHGNAPPFCLTHGEMDVVVPPNQSLLFRNALAAAGVSVECHIVPDEPHTGLERVTRPGEPLGGLDAFHGFFRRHLG